MELEKADRCLQVAGDALEQLMKAADLGWLSFCGNV
jgi:hypothetical protein